jgi:hypothetical protein
MGVRKSVESIAAIFQFFNFVGRFSVMTIQEFFDHFFKSRRIHLKSLTNLFNNSNNNNSVVNNNNNNNIA